MAVVIFAQTLQWRLDALNQALHNANGERTNRVKSMERTIQQYVGRRINLVYMESIGEYGIFSSNEPYQEDPTLV